MQVSIMSAWGINPGDLVVTFYSRLLQVLLPEIFLQVFLMHEVNVGL
jgi:hypothetical protein